MKIIEKTHTVVYQEPWEGIPEDTDIILYWEAPVTECGKDRENYLKIKNHPKPKILLFAGGNIKKEWVDKFDLLLVESALNAKECDDLGIPQMTAFGVDTSKMKPERQPKVFDAAFPSTCAGWKRQGLFAEALSDRGVICGRFQESDPEGFLMARKHKTLVLPEIPYEAVNALYNASWCCVNTSSYWGGGQRTTLEAMAAGIPVIVMEDSPKNREYVEESGAGIVVAPSPEAIRNAIEEIKKWTPEQRSRGIDYVNGKWTAQHYADNIIKGINQVLNK
jgi:glycosyltransferase involved in cell wall biosynthesis